MPREHDQWRQWLVYGGVGAVRQYIVNGGLQWQTGS